MKKFFALSFVLIFGLIMSGSQVYGQIYWHVYPGDKIQNSIDLAVAGDYVIVHDGVYSGDGNIDLDFNGKAIHMCSANGPDNCIIDCKGKSRAILFNHGEGPGSIFEGFTVINGKVTTWGGGVYAINASPIIRNVHCYNCYAGNNGGGFAINNGSPQFINCSAERCFAYDGAGMILYGDNPDQIYIENCQFVDNQASRKGGGMYIAGHNKPKLFINCDIKNNRARSGAGVYIINTHDITFENCEVTNNRAVFNGGGFMVLDRSSVSMKKMDVSNNISGNIGGAIAILGSSFEKPYPMLRFESGRISANQSAEGGGIMGFNALIRIKESELIGNANYAVFVAIESVTPLPDIVNCIFKNNQPEDFNY